MYSYTKEEFLSHIGKKGKDEINKLFPVQQIFDFDKVIHDLLLNPGCHISLRRFVKQSFVCPFSDHVVSYIHCSLTVTFLIDDGFLKYNIIDITLFNNAAESEREMKKAKSNEKKLPVTTPQWN